MISAALQWLKRAFRVSPPPLAVFIDASDSSTVRYELFPRFISRTSVSPRAPEGDAVYFMSGLQANPRSILESIGLPDRDRLPDEQARLDDFLSRAVTCVKHFEKAAIPAFAPMATPGINQIFFTKGQEFTTTKPIPVSVHVAYYGPCSGGGGGKLPAGVRIRVAEDSVDYTKFTACQVLEPYYSELENSLVPKGEMAHELYAGYSVSIESRILRDCCAPAKSETPGGLSQ